jgi:uncharacterized protein YfiM (DUF2279 family)
MERMNREQFYAAIAGLDEERLRKTLWTVYWRSAAPVRQRIEAEIAPPEAKPAARAAAAKVDPDDVLDDVRRFVALARAGSYLAGDRRVSPKERTRWRFTFRRLVADTRAALAEAEIGPGVAAVVELVDLACEMHDYDYFRSDDPVEAAGVVVSDEVGALWARVLAVRGFPAFAEQAAGQFVRWEKPYGWTRRGSGRVSEKESGLTTVLAGMLPVPDSWVGFTERYLDALDRAGAATSGGRASSWRTGEAIRSDRARAMAGWHGLLLDRFAGTEEEPLLDRIADSPGLGGPELTFFRARLAERRGDLAEARSLARHALQALPGHDGFRQFARDIGSR